MVRFRQQAGSYSGLEKRSASVCGSGLYRLGYERALRLLGLRFSCVEIG